MKYIHPHEKFGGKPTNRSKMERFNNFLNTTNLLDLGFIGRSTLGLIAEKLVILLEQELIGLMQIQDG